jgi:hypothetical protein
MSLKRGWGSAYDGRLLWRTLTGDGDSKVDDIRGFLDGTMEMEFAGPDKAKRLHWMRRTLVRIPSRPCLPSLLASHPDTNDGSVRVHRGIA